MIPTPTQGAAAGFVEEKSNSRAERMPDIPNPNPFDIHSAVHTGSPNAHCVVHTHSLAGMTVASMPEGLLPLNQMRRSSNRGRNKSVSCGQHLCASSIVIRLNLLREPQAAGAEKRTGRRLCAQRRTVIWARACAIRSHSVVGRRQALHLPPYLRYPARAARSPYSFPLLTCLL